MKKLLVVLFMLCAIPSVAQVEFDLSPEQVKALSTESPVFEGENILSYMDTVWGMPTMIGFIFEDRKLVTINYLFLVKITTKEGGERLWDFCHRQLVTNMYVSESGKKTGIYMSPSGAAVVMTFINDGPLNTIRISVNKLKIKEKR